MNRRESVHWMGTGFGYAALWDLPAKEAAEPLSFQAPHFPGKAKHDAGPSNTITAFGRTCPRMV